MSALTTRNLTKKFGKKTVVNGIDLTVDKSMIFGFLGKNGAGKSTFINMITGLMEPTDGSFEILGHMGKGIRDIQHRIGVLPDYSSFYDDLTALDHLKYFSKVMKLSTPKKEMIDTLERVGLEDAIQVKAKNFSFGMKKKLGIAQAIINKPDILFLDEPTSGVDANSILSIHTLINEIAATGTTIFLTSHNLDEVEKLCDEVAIMNNGTIQTKGNMEQLRAHYKRDITLYIKHSSILEGSREKMGKDLSVWVNDVNLGDTLSEILIEEEKFIPEINKIFVINNINVYRLEVDEPSLEEIFLNLNEQKDSA
ncbi:ABC transporter ATP-binding protein [Thalassobacillus devorans]|uniref:ABC transporter ATP-binding protein n=1 Tax=Thalassobacillus devorans TaxID=279813 RepID=UPI000A1C808C|nr:ABC transporter ATP-binding protein [Thalassobacillus devorans]